MTFIEIMKHINVESNDAQKNNVVEILTRNQLKNVDFFCNNMYAPKNV